MRRMMRPDGSSVSSINRAIVHDVLSPFSTRRICSRDAKRKQESGNVIG